MSSSECLGTLVDGAAPGVKFPLILVCYGDLRAPLMDSAVLAGLACITRATWTVWHDFDAVSTL